MTKKELFSHAATILPCTDMEKCAKFYSEKLGFEITFQWGEPIDYIVLKRGEGVSIHLTKRSDQQTPSTSHVALYIFTHDVDALYEEYQKKDVSIHTPIETKEYGMRDFDVMDPEGHILAFGMGV